MSTDKLILEAVWNVVQCFVDGIKVNGDHNERFASLLRSELEDRNLEIRPIECDPDDPVCGECFGEIKSGLVVDGKIRCHGCLEAENALPVVEIDFASLEHLATVKDVRDTITRQFMYPLDASKPEDTPSLAEVRLFDEARRLKKPEPAPERGDYRCTQCNALFEDGEFAAFSEQGMLCRQCFLADMPAIAVALHEAAQDFAHVAGNVSHVQQLDDGTQVEVRITQATTWDEFHGKSEDPAAKHGAALAAAWANSNG